MAGMLHEVVEVLLHGLVVPAALVHDLALELVEHGGAAGVGTDLLGQVSDVLVQRALLVMERGLGL